jgi:hypothetical protein
MKTDAERIAELESAIAELKRANEKPAPFVPGPPLTIRRKVGDREWDEVILGTEQVALNNAVRANHGDATMREYAKAAGGLRGTDGMRNQQEPSSIVVKPAAAPVADPNPNQKNTSGWREAVPLRKWRS